MATATVNPNASSVVGYTETGGRILAKDYDALHKALTPQRATVLFAGGALFRMTHVETGKSFETAFSKHKPSDKYGPGWVAEKIATADSDMFTDFPLGESLALGDTQCDERCVATTKKGTQCSKRKVSGYAYCHQHLGM